MSAHHTAGELFLEKSKVFIVDRTPDRGNGGEPGIGRAEAAITGAAGAAWTKGADIVDAAGSDGRVELIADKADDDAVMPAMANISHDNAYNPRIHGNTNENGHLITPISCLVPLYTIIEINATKLFNIR